MARTPSRPEIRCSYQTTCPVLCSVPLQACTSAMNLSEEVDLEDYVARPDKINNAEIASICQVGASDGRDAKVLCVVVVVVVGGGRPAPTRSTTPKSRPPAR